MPLNPAQPLLTLGRLVQEDLCLMEPQGDEYDLTGAILCFPASWTLAQKIGRPMTGIHHPVEIYDDDLAAPGAPPVRCDPPRTAAVADELLHL